LSQDEINRLIVRKAREGRRVVRLKGGDPFVFGRGAEEAQQLHDAGIAFEIIPGITSAIAAPAYAGIPVTHRSHNVAFTVLTGHEDPTKPESAIDWSRFADAHQTLVLLMAMGNLERIVEQLKVHGLPGTIPVAVIREGTRPTQHTLVGTLDSIVADVARAGLGAPAIVVIGDVVSVRDRVRWFDTGPLFGKRVLVTRPADQSAAFADALLEFGAQAILAPLISTGAPDDTAAARAVLSRLTDYDWIVFTSRNGVERFFDALREENADARRIGTAKVAAIGVKTAHALQAHGVIADLIPKDAVAESIAAALLEQTTPHSRILIYRAQEARETLPATLGTHGHRVDVVAAYKTSAVADPQLAQKLADADIVTFTSASTVAAFFDTLGPDAATLCASKTIACIGPVTARAARDAGLRVDVEATDSSVEGLLDALENTLASTASASLR
ncbi:MAG: uroporphyrinogen-III C-methyltransferase, partial [Candidatus Eremiobacteraeota bacterium]|nr:uroporphyrinogen-III C-methyltransferase [Candidatus Eremiobacteraeota bacterium]